MKIFCLDAAYFGVEICIPIKLAETFQKAYPKSKNWHKCINAWAIEDFGFICKDENGPTEKEINILTTCIKQRFYRLYPLFSILDFVTIPNQYALWVIEHMEKDLHRKNEYLLMSRRPNLKERIKVAEFLGVDLDVKEDYFKHRFLEK